MPRHNGKARPAEDHARKKQNGRSAHALHGAWHAWCMMILIQPAKIYIAQEAAYMGLKHVNVYSYLFMSDPDAAAFLDL